MASNNKKTSSKTPTSTLGVRSSAKTSKITKKTSASKTGRARVSKPARYSSKEDPTRVRVSEGLTSTISRAKTASLRTKKPTTFFDLSPELRNKIYALVFDNTLQPAPHNSHSISRPAQSATHNRIARASTTPSTPSTLGNTWEPNLLHTHPQIRAEARGIFFASTVFIFNSTKLETSAAAAWLRSVPPTLLPHIPQIQLCFTAPWAFKWEHCHNLLPIVSAVYATGVSLDVLTVDIAPHWRVWTIRDMLELAEQAAREGWAEATLHAEFDAWLKRKGRPEVREVVSSGWVSAARMEGRFGLRVPAVDK